MLTSKTVTQGVSSVLQALQNEDVDGARKLIEEISREVKTEREMGILAAARGIATSMAKGKEGALQNWSYGKVVRAAETIIKSQMSDDFDFGYAETLVEYAKLLPHTE
jgi:G:T/U-mismatch repair DNA glycosylase